MVLLGPSWNGLLIIMNQVTNLPTVLHIGCGVYWPEKLHSAFRQRGWRELRLDIDPTVEPDIVASMTDMSSLNAGSVDGIFSSHNLEHLYPHEVPVALAEFKRVLAPQGVALITVPDLQSVAQLVAADKLCDPAYVSSAGPIAPIDILYGHRPAMAKGNLFMAHRTGFTARTLAETVVAAGFATVSVQRDASKFALWALGFMYHPSPEELATWQTVAFPHPVQTPTAAV